jgi:hypothetical protein
MTTAPWSADYIRSTSIALNTGSPTGMNNHVSNSHNRSHNHNSAGISTKISATNINYNNSNNINNNNNSNYKNNNNNKKKKEKKMQIETKTSAKNINITWHIDKQSIDIAKLAQRGDKKGVILADLECDGYLFKLELCAPGWRNSQNGFSAFYLTVPKLNRNNNSNHNKKNKAQQKTSSSAIDDNNSNNSSNNIINNSGLIDNNFVARYSVLFGEDEKHVRVSSIRNDFDLGVGFPNFTEISTLDNAIVCDQLRFHIQIDIFSCESTVKKPKPELQKEKISSLTVAKIMRDMYYQSLHSNVMIICSNNRRIPAHKSILTSASPVFRTFFAHSCRENTTGKIFMNEWNPVIVHAMVRFLYLGVIEFVQQNDERACHQRQRQRRHQKKRINNNKNNKNKKLKCQQKKQNLFNNDSNNNNCSSSDDDEDEDEAHNNDEKSVDLDVHDSDEDDKEEHHHQRNDTNGLLSLDCDDEIVLGIGESDVDDGDDDDEEEEEDITLKNHKISNTKQMTSHCASHINQSCMCVAHLQSMTVPEMKTAEHEFNNNPNHPKTAVGVFKHGSGSDSLSGEEYKCSMMSDCVLLSSAPSAISAAKGMPRSPSAMKYERSRVRQNTGMHHIPSQNNSRRNLQHLYPPTMEDTKSKCDNTNNNMVNNNNNNANNISNDCDCPLIVKKLFELFQLAECYKISDLLICCCQQLYQHLSVETACIFLMYLDKFSHVSEITEIQTAIWDYMSNNVQDIKGTPGWQTLLSSRPHLLGELIDRLTVYP